MKTGGYRNSAFTPTRFVGCIEGKCDGASAIPDSSYNVLKPEDIAIVLGSASVFQRVSLEQVVQIVVDALKEELDEEGNIIVQNLAALASKRIISLAEEIA